MRKLFTRILALLLVFQIVLLSSNTMVYAIDSTPENNDLVSKGGLPSKADGMGDYFIIIHRAESGTGVYKLVGSDYPFWSKSPYTTAFMTGALNETGTTFTTGSVTYWTWDYVNKVWGRPASILGKDIDGTLVWTNHDIYAMGTSRVTGNTINADTTTILKFPKNLNSTPYDTLDAADEIGSLLLQRLGIVGDNITPSKAGELLVSAISPSSWTEFVRANYNFETSTLTIPKPVVVSLKDRIIAFAESDSQYKIVPAGKLDAETIKAGLKGVDVTVNGQVTGTRYGSVYDTNTVGNTDLLDGMLTLDLTTSDIAFEVCYADVGFKYMNAAIEVPSNYEYVISPSTGDSGVLNKLTFYDALGATLPFTRSGGKTPYIYKKTTNVNYASEGLYNMEDFDSFRPLRIPFQYEGYLFYRFANTTPLYQSIDIAKSVANGDTPMYFMSDDIHSNAQEVSISTSLMETDWSAELTSFATKVKASYTNAANSRSGWTNTSKLLTNKATMVRTMTSAASGAESNLVQVSASMPETYTITVPKAVNLQAELSKSFDIVVRGSLIPGRVLTIVMPNQVDLTEEESLMTEAADINATKTAFLASEVSPDADAISTVTVTRTKVSPGNWSGNFAVGVLLTFE